MSSVDVVIPTYNASDLVARCVAHLTDPEIASVIVVDDVSNDGTVKAIRNSYPSATVVELEEHRGLAHAFNRGTRAGSAPFVLFLNNDVFATPGAVCTLVGALRADPLAVSAGGRLVDPGTHQTQDAYRPRATPGLAALIARLVGVERLWPHNPWTGQHLRRPLSDARTVRTDHQPAGACLLVRRSAFERIGGWDERYWIWYEDVDLLRRLLSIGPTLYVPAAVFEHIGGASTSGWPRHEQHRRLYYGTLQYGFIHLRSVERRALGAIVALAMFPRLLWFAWRDTEAFRVYRAIASRGLAMLMGRPVPPMVNPDINRDAVGPPMIADGDQAAPGFRQPGQLTRGPTLTTRTDASGRGVRSSSVKVDAIPEVSVVIPTRNRWDLLARSGLRAALMQEDVDLEIIVVDDGSTDETQARLAALEDPRVRVIRHDQRQGVANARNRGIAEARAPWLAFLDDDDLWAPNKLRRQLDLAKATTAGFVYGAAVVVDDQCKLERMLEMPEPATLSEDLARKNVVPAGQSNVLVRTDAVRRLGGFDPRLSLIADWDMWIRLAHAERSAVCHDVLVAYVLHSEGMQVLESRTAGAREFAHLTSKQRLNVAERRTAGVLWARWQASVHRRAGRRVRASQAYLRSALLHRNGGMLVRAVAVLIGEWTMHLGGGYRLPRSARAPDWISLYRNKRFDRSPADLADERPKP